MASNYKEKYDESEGVWRTIGGRRVFIKKGQSLSEAMIESGKFKNLRSEYRKAKEEEKKQEIDPDALDKKAIELYEKRDDEGWGDFTDEELKELARQCQITQDNPFGRAYDDEVFEEMDKRGLSLSLDKEDKEEIFSLSEKQIEAGKKLNENALNGARADIKSLINNEVDYDGTKQDFINDLSKEWAVDKEELEKIYEEESKNKISKYFSDKEKYALENKDYSYDYSKETLKNMSDEDLDGVIAKKQELVNEYTNKYNQDLTYDQRTTRNKQDTLWDKGMKTKYEQGLMEAQEEKFNRQTSKNANNGGDFVSQSTNPLYPDATYTKEQLDKMAENGVQPMKNTYSGNGWKGINADKNLSTKEQAKAVTDAMKQKYSDVKISRKSDVYSGGSSIDFNIMSSDKDLYISDADIDKLGSEQLFNTDITRGYGFERWANENVDNYRTDHTYSVDDVKKYAKETLANLKSHENQNVSGDEWYLSDYGKKVVSDLNKEANSYTYDDSDAMTDYFNHGTYMNVSIGKWDKPYQVNSKFGDVKDENYYSSIGKAAGELTKEYTEQGKQNVPKAEILKRAEKIYNNDNKTIKQLNDEMLGDTFKGKGETPSLVYSNNRRIDIANNENGGKTATIWKDGKIERKTNLPENVSGDKTKDYFDKYLKELDNSNAKSTNEIMNHAIKEKAIKKHYGEKLAEMEKNEPEFLKNATKEERNNYYKNKAEIEKMKEMGQYNYLLEKQRQRGGYNDERPNELQTKANEVVKAMAKNKASEKSTNETMNNAIREKAYKKYLKEHPRSKISFEQFKNKK